MTALMNGRANFNQEQLKESAKLVTDLIEKEILVLDEDPKRVFIGGFS